MDYYEDNRGRSESIMSTAELDLNDLERSLAEVKENLLQVLQEDNEQVQIPHYYQLIQLVNNMAMVTDEALKGQKDNGDEMASLFQQNAELNQRLLGQETQLVSAEDEMRTQSHRIEQLEADLALAESNYTEAQDQVTTGKVQLDNYLAINKDLQMQIEAFTKASKDSSSKVSDTLNEVIGMQNEKIAKLEKEIVKFTLSDQKQQKTLTDLQSKYEEVLGEKKQFLKELQQNEILYEKNVYKQQTKIKEYKYIIHEQKKGIVEMEIEIEVFKRKQTVALVKKQAQAEALGNSFTEFQNPISRGQSLNERRQVSTTSADEFSNVQIEEPMTPTIIDDKGGPMDIEAPNDLEGFDGQENNELDGFDIIAREQSGVSDVMYKQESYVTDNSKRGDLIQEYQDYRSNGSEEERDVYNDEREIQVEEEAADAQVKRESNYRRSSYLQSITEEGTVLSDHELFQDPLRTQGKTNGETQDEIYNKRDPEEEFFMLSVLALKMLATEKYDDTEYIYEVHAEKMFNQVRDADMPFHQWYGWLQGQFEDLRQKGLSPYQMPQNAAKTPTTKVVQHKKAKEQKDQQKGQEKSYLNNIDTLLEYDESKEPPKTSKSKGMFSRFFKKGDKKPKRSQSPGLSAKRTDEEANDERADQLFRSDSRRERTMTMNEKGPKGGFQF